MIGAYASQRHVVIPGPPLTPLFDGRFQRTTATGQATLNLSGPTIFPFNNPYYKDPARLQIVSDNPRQGTYALEMECRAGDSGGGSDRVAVETSAQPSSYQGVPSYYEVNFDDEIWIALSFWFRVFIPPPNPLGHKIFYQQKTNDPLTSASPPISLNNHPADGTHPNGYLEFKIRGGVATTTAALSQPPVSSGIGAVLGTPTIGVWHDFLMHLKISTAPADRISECYYRNAGNTPPYPGAFTGAETFASVAGENCYGVGPAGQEVFPPQYLKPTVYRSTPVEPPTETDFIRLGGMVVGDSQAAAETLWA